MQLPSSTHSTESNPLAALFPCAPMPAGKPGPGARGHSDFGQLVAEFASSETESGPPVAGSDAEAFMATLSSLLAPPTPVVCPTPAGEAATEVGPDDITGEPGTGEFGDALTTSDAPETSVKPALASKAERAAARALRGHAQRDARSDAPATEKEKDAATALHQPNEHAAAAALETPRFHGLPAGALEHRQASSLPPGISRLMAARTPAEPDANAPAEPSLGEEVDVAGNSIATTDAIVDPDAGANAATFTAEAFEEISGTATDATTSDLEAADFADESAGVENPAQIEGATSELVETSSSASAGTDAAAILGEPEVTNAIVTHGRALHGRAVAARAKSGAHGRDEDPADTASELPPGLANVVEDVFPHRANAAAQVALARSPALAAAEAKIAGSNDGAIGGPLADENTEKKSSLDGEGERVNSHRKGLGIGGAKPTPTMFARFLPTPLQPTASDPAPAGVAPVAVVDLVSSAFEEVSATQSVSSAHQAVEVVLHTAEQLSAREQKSVNLQFSVGDADLSVRVELHANEVRATFRTDSAELRAALSQEWQNTGHSDRSVRVVPAILAASDQSAPNASADDASSRHRNPHTERGETAAGFASLAPRRSSPPAAAAVALPALTPLVASRTSRHLQTVA